MNQNTQEDTTDVCYNTTTTVGNKGLPKSDIHVGDKEELIFDHDPILDRDIVTPLVPSPSTSVSVEPVAPSNAKKSHYKSRIGFAYTIGHMQSSVTC